MYGMSGKIFDFELLYQQHSKRCPFANPGILCGLDFAGPVIYDVVVLNNGLHRAWGAPTMRFPWANPFASAIAASGFSLMS